MLPKNGMKIYFIPSIVSSSIIFGHIFFEFSFHLLFPLVPVIFGLMCVVFWYHHQQSLIKISDSFGWKLISYESFVLLVCWIFIVVCSAFHWPKCQCSYMFVMCADECCSLFVFLISVMNSHIWNAWIRTIVCVCSVFFSVFGQVPPFVSFFLFFFHILVPKLEMTSHVIKFNKTWACLNVLRYYVTDERMVVKDVDRVIFQNAIVKRKHFMRIK